MGVKLFSSEERSTSPMRFLLRRVENPRFQESQSKETLRDDVSREGLTLTWRDLSVYAKVRTEKWFNSASTEYKRIINNVSGAVRPGTLVALMGASGAGKSTLMSALAYQTTAAMVVDGDIRVNGRPLGPFMRKVSGYMDQDDIFINTLTVTEYLRFMARLKLDRRISSRRREMTISQLLTSLGLAHCGDVRIGAADEESVLSGGERKRLSFAAACLTDPPLLFCDEPTTGLDSFSAATIVQALQTFAAAGKTVVCTIHQPSSELFTMFHQILLVADGRIAYLGPSHTALDFFQSIGYVCPEDFNPADYLIQTLALTPGSESSSRRSIKHICDQFAVSDYARELELQINFQHQMGHAFDDVLDSRLKSSKQPRWISKLWWLTNCALLEILRDPKVQQIRLLHKIAIALMVGLCFVGSLHLTQTGIQATQGALFMLVTENTFGPMYAVLPLFPAELPLVMRHYRAGLYGPLAYYLAKIVAIIPGLVVEPVVFTGILYWLAGLQNTVYAFIMTSIIVTLCINVSTACGCFFSATFESVAMAMTYLVPFDYAIMITSGNFIKLDTLSPQLSWVQYLSWMMYSNEAMTIIQWQDIQNITCEEDLPCLHSGTEVLERYSFSADNFWRDIYALVALFAAFHVLAYFALCRTIKRNS
ncbi:protein scarlet [Macrosteles quadrilineatus]|uniref:protein scarlet n=1 Tax=Macrosteles quadrilineatus TaxID=74068 RepID=UPI0023E3104C|nr:protein scarlet [Macrosteles quadrilineatus]